jgi:hypothetical protein
VLLVPGDGTEGLAHLDASAVSQASFKLRDQLSFRHEQSRRECLQQVYQLRVLLHVSFPPYRQ